LGKGWSTLLVAGIVGKTVRDETSRRCRTPRNRPAASPSSLKLAASSYSILPLRRYRCRQKWIKYALPFAGVRLAGAGHWDTGVIAGAPEQPQGSQAPTVVWQGLEYITGCGHWAWAAGRRNQSQIRHPAAPLSRTPMVIKISNFFIVRFSHRNGIVAGEDIAKKLYTMLNDVQTQQGCI
jgi:hypothetical protein